MYNSRQVTGVFLIILSLLAVSVVMMIGSMNFVYLIWPIVLIVIVEILFIVFIRRWVTSNPEKRKRAENKIDTFLSQLNDDDLDLLRHRLMQDERETDYGSMAELIQSRKRKNEMRDI